jgi:hypothetical protein
MRAGKIKILQSRLQRTTAGEPLAGGELEPPIAWWRHVMRGLGSSRKRRAQATLQRLAQSDVEDTISEADIQGWLRMLEMESAGGKATAKTKAKAESPVTRRPRRHD